MSQTIMKLRYIVEGKFSSTFTASKKCMDVEQARKWVVGLKSVNARLGFNKYSRFILYDHDNNVKERY